ncbi:NTP transferase domain-containing protein [Pusillimonas sp. TS35]|uniref:N-acetylmuramate alpha-1-phosphate uridylyltransferase MurU n=1 Tax=Paracandidimonas lactea TaxID=2895524 RepID=UPI001368020D|nr:nucleotidyltransferase family protein [Paracandidimonas lactea]MYN14923.1 NTP transferase domain-containing protein [Pusillimonas sp. TS35]
MRAMILAAGRGERMRPLTDSVPKPLLRAGGKPLIAWHIERLVAAGITDIIINHAWLGDQIEQALGDGSTFGARLAYSPEPPGALETAGGIAQALPFFHEQPFLVVNGDVWCDWPATQAPAFARALADSGRSAWLLLADNPPQHPQGDFCLLPDGTVHDKAADTGAGQILTFSGIGIYTPALFAPITPGMRAPLAPLLRHAMLARQVTGTRHAGAWEDIGTPERLSALDRRLGTASRA